MPLETEHWAHHEFADMLGLSIKTGRKDMTFEEYERLCSELVPYVHKYVEIGDEFAVHETPAEDAQRHAIKVGLGEHGEVGFAISCKAANVKFRIKAACLDALFAVGGIASALAGGPAWALPLAIIFAARKVAEATSVALSQDAAIVILAMWSNRDEHTDSIKKDSVSSAVKSFQAAGRSLTDSDIERAIRMLEAMECIETAREDPSSWRLCETVRAEYVSQSQLLFPR